jgi:RNA polymerase sigma factor (sigma-70 family)
MADTQLRTVVRHLHKLVRPHSDGGSSDGKLLQRFVSQHDEVAFEVLVWRHGAMVWNVCRRLLRSTQDAEDAFQASFLALLRAARSIRAGTAIGGWLYKVAYRVALKAKARAANRARRETPGVDLLFAEPTEPDLLWRDLRPVLDEEINRLRSQYRLPLVLCYLEGKTTTEAAQLLGCPRGTVATRLAWARQRLRARLTRRGLTLSSTAVLATLLSEHALSASLPGGALGLRHQRRHALPHGRGSCGNGAGNDQLAS